MNITIRKATASERFPGSYSVTVNGKMHDALGWGEMLEVIIAATTGAKDLPYQQGDAPIAVLVPADELKRISWGISDVACWINGFKAATPDAYDRHPMNAGVLTDINEKIKVALERAEGDRT